jgi:hypothetical protein
MLELIKEKYLKEENFISKLDAERVSVVKALVPLIAISSQAAFGTLVLAVVPSL